MSAELTAQELIEDWLSEHTEDLPDNTPVIIKIGDRLNVLDKLGNLRAALLPAQTEPDAGRVEEAAPQADLVTESEVYAALRGWQKAIIDAPEEGVEERRRRCMRAALKAARACSSAQSRQNTPPSPPREEIEHQGVVAVGVKG